MPKFPNSPQFPDIGQNPVGGISDFRILVKFLINKNCHNFRISNDIGTKLGPVTEFDRKKTTASKKFDDDVVSANYDVTFIIFF